MTLLEFPIRRHQFTLIAFLCVAALGVYAFLGLPREEDPHLKLPAFLITAVQPGADPVDIEQVFVKPMEDRIATLEDVKRLETTIIDGAALVAVEFEPETDADRKLDEVNREVDALRTELPPSIRRIEIRRAGPTLVSILQVALVSEDAPYTEMEDAARDLADLLKTVPGVRGSDTWAYPKRELRVQFDPARLDRLGITAAQLAQALQAGNSNVPAGFIDLDTRSFSLLTSGGFRSLDDVRNAVVASRNGAITRVSDVAEVRWHDQQLTHTGRFNGRRAVFVTATQKDGYNILDVQKSIDAALDRFESGLPARVKLERGFAQSRNVADRLHRLYIDFSIAIALVLLTLLPLGLRAASIVMIAMPLSLAIGMTALFFLGYSFNQITIAGFVLSLGLLVDDSIVVVENISRHLRSGMSRIDAALAGTRQIVQAILGCTATLIFAFLPLAAMPGNAGKFIRVLPVTIIATIMGSLLVALLFIPFLASRMLRGAPGGDASGTAPSSHNVLLDRLMGAIHRYYRPALHRCLSRPRTTVIVAIGGSLLLVAALVPVLGSSLFPKADTPQFLISISTPNGSSFAETDRALRFTEEALRHRPEIRNWFSNLGHGNPQVYYNHLVGPDSANTAEIFVQLKEYDAHRTPALLDALRADVAGYAGAHIYVREFIQGEPISAPVSVRVFGQDLDQLTQLAAQIETLVEGVPGTRDVNNPLRVARTNLRLAPDPQKAALLGVPVAQFDQAVRLTLAGAPAGLFRSPDGEQYDIVLRAATQERAGFDTLGEVRIPTQTGKLLPLSQLATLKFASAPTRIQRFKRERAVTIDAQVLTGQNTAAVTRAVKAKLDQFSWPRGYRYELGGEAEASANAFGGIGVAILVALFGIFAILVLEFGDFRSTLIVLTVVPLGALGGFLALLATGYDISFTAAVGFVALIGIEIKNSILLVDFTNQLREQGMALDEAIEQAGEIRFLPILLTSATAIGGLLPLALQGSGLYSPMSWTIIGGLITSTLLARLVTPVVYKLLPPTIAAAGRRSSG
ncbi:MAG TPA: efflux RND transporter permease subunit [Steroidobacteraceae bacterium]|nr:efflux RND transporter permease subunit [Steroidobacteraceae bacterium]